MQLGRAKFRHLIVGRPAQNVGNAQVCGGRCDDRTGVHYRFRRSIAAGAATSTMPLIFFFGGNRCDWRLAPEGYGYLDDLPAPPFCNVPRHRELRDKLIDFRRRGIEDEAP